LKWHRASARFTILVAGLLAADPGLTRAAVSATGQPGMRLDVLSYNIRNLPDTRFASRKPLIQKIAGEFDIVLLQEDFRPDALHDDWPGWRARGPGPRFRPSYLLTPIIRLLGHNAPHGAGLSILSRPPDPSGPLLDAQIIASMAYDHCHGVFGESFDCWANKGLLGVRLTVAGGGSLDVYTTHLDAGAAAGNRVVRARQLAQLTEAVASFSRNRAVLLSGDFNAPPQRRPDHRALARMAKELSLTDSGAGPVNPASNPCRVMRTYYRSGSSTRLTVLDVGEVAASMPASNPDGMNFCSNARKQRGLSDHPALEIQLLVEGSSRNH